MNIKMQPTNSYILHANPGPLSFTVGDWNDYENFYAAIPCGKMLAVMHKSKILKQCRTTQSAMKYIEKHQKRKRKRV